MTQFCEDCNNLFSNTMNDTQAFMFYTISPDPKRLEYGNLEGEHQMYRLFSTIRECVRALKSTYGIRCYTIHYENNRSGNVHAHGLISVSSMFSHYDATSYAFQRYVSKALGRKGVPYKTCMNIQWPTAGDLETVCCYCNKGNVFPPDHRFVGKSGDYPNEIDLQEFEEWNELVNPFDNLFEE